MQPIWEMLHQEMTEIYTIHAVMALKITEDVERPLRSALQSDADYEAVKSVNTFCEFKNALDLWLTVCALYKMDATMQRLCRDYDERLVRVNKVKP